MSEKITCPNCSSLNCKIDYSYPTMDTNPPEYTFVCQECKEIFQRKYMARTNMHDESIKIKLEERWKESKQDRDYAARIAKRDEAIAFAKYRKLREERGSDKN